MVKVKLESVKYWQGNDLYEHYFPLLGHTYFMYYIKDGQYKYDTYIELASRGEVFDIMAKLRIPLILEVEGHDRDYDEDAYKGVDYVVTIFDSNKDY